MKKILIVNNNLRIGGVQKALVSLLRELAEDPALDVTLLLFHPGGALMERLPARVRVITPCAAWRCWGLTRADAAPLPDRALRAGFAGVTRLFGRAAAARLASPFQPTLRGYDVAVSYLHSGAQRAFYGGCNEFVLRHVEAGRKLAFLHCDYEALGADCAANTAVYRAFDAIAACSEGCRDAFLRVLPELREKTFVVPNCCDLAGLAPYADAQPRPVHTPLRVITVARLGREKGAPRAIRAVAALGERAQALRYTVVGDGAERETCRALIAQHGLADIVTLAPERPDPYAALRDSDVLLIPSLSEAAPLVIAEAAALGVPTLTTETSSARELVERTGFGWVCENSEAGVRQGLQFLLDHPEAVEAKRTALRAVRLDNRAAAQRFMELIDANAT